MCFIKMAKVAVGKMNIMNMLRRSGFKMMGEKHHGRLFMVSGWLVYLYVYVLIRELCKFMCLIKSTYLLNGKPISILPLVIVEP